MNLLFGGEEGNGFVEDLGSMREEVSAVKMCEGLHRGTWELAVEVESESAAWWRRRVDQKGHLLGEHCDMTRGCAHQKRDLGSIPMPDYKPFKASE